MSKTIEVAVENCRVTSAKTSQLTSGKRFSRMMNFHLPDRIPLVTMQSDFCRTWTVSVALYEHWRDHPKLPPSERHVPGRHRKAHRTSALLPLARGKWPHDSVARHAGQDCRRHGITSLAILLRLGTHERVEGL